MGAGSGHIGRSPGAAGMTAIVRTVSADDWRSWRDSWLRASRDPAGGPPGPFADAGGESGWRARIEAGGLALAADVDGTPAALAQVVLETAAEAVVAPLWTAASTAGATAGHALLEAVLRWASRNTTAERVVVTAADGDARTAGLCLRAGFDAVAGGTGPLVGRTGPRALVRRIERGVRVGVHSGQQYRDFGSIHALWRDAERLGYDWASLFDHYRPPIFGPDGPCLDATATLSALAATTPRVRCGLLVSPPVWRHPALTATAAATIDHISGGRLELGVGVGGGDLAFEQYGIERPPLKVRFERLDEACHVLRLLFDGGPADFDGRHYRLRGAYLNPRPPQRRLPLVIGGAGERFTLPLVVRHADVWNCAIMPVDAYGRIVETLSALCEKSGRAPGDIRRSMTFRAVITSGRAEAERARRDIADDRHGHRQDLPEYACFGSAQECLDRLAPYAELGVRDFLLGLRPPLDRRTMERFAEQVAPHLRRMAAA